MSFFVICLIALSWATYRITFSGIQQGEAAYETRRDVFLLLSDLIDQETGLRGFTSTKQSLFLGPYSRGHAAFTADMRRTLDSSAAANTTQVNPPLHDIDALYKLWRREVATPLLRNPNRRDASAIQTRGKLLMDRMRVDNANALSKLDDVTRANSAQTRRSLTLLAALSVAIGLALYGAIIVVLRIQQRIAGERDRYINSAQDIVALCSTDGYFININPAAEHILGYSRADLQAKPFMSFVHAEDVKSTTEAMSALTDGKAIQGFRNRYRTADGSFRWLVWNAVPDVGRRVIYASARDETERVQSELDHVVLAYKDELTGLPNRASFMTHAALALSVARRFQSGVTVVLFDLDGFKAVNDQYGHATGDAVLRVVAERVRYALRETDVFARLGGDEFTVLLQSQTGAPNVSAVVRKIKDSLRNPQLVGEIVVRVGASIGTATFPNDGESVEALLAHADKAMYSAKKFSANP